MPAVYIGIGTNLGDRHQNIKTAFSLLNEAGIKIIKQSTIIETDPVGGPPQNKYLNCVIKVTTKLLPIELLNLLKTIEKQMGRIKNVINGPRIIDLDILLYDKINFVSNNLVIPHPRMLYRDFVLKPLKEIEPELLKDLLNACN